MSVSPQEIKVTGNEVDLEYIEKIATKAISLTKLLQDGTIKVEPHLPKNIQSNVKAVTVSVEVLAHKDN